MPTLRSRMLIIPKNCANHTPVKDRPLQGCKGRSFTGFTGVAGVDVERFLKSDKAHRLELLKGIIEEKDKNASISFLNELEQVLYRKFGGSKAKLLEEIIKCKKYLNGRAPSVKMILEHIALIIP